MRFLSKISTASINRANVLLIVASIISATFIWDWLTPRGYAVWLAYLIAVLLGAVLKRRRVVYVIAGLCTCLIAVGFFLSSPGVKISISVFNRTFGVATVWIVAILLERRNLKEQLLQESEERYRNLRTATSEVVYRMNSDWTEMCRLSGKNFIADTGKPNRNWLAQYIHPDDQAKVTAAIDAAIRTKSVFELEHRVLREDGTVGWTFSRAIPQLDATGEVREWIGASSDITERKRVEVALQQSEERYRTLFSTMKEGFCVIEVIFDAENRPVDCRLREINSAFTAQTGWEGAEGKRLRELAPDIEQFWFDTYGKVALTGESAHFENRAKVLDRWFEVSAYRVGEPGEPKVAVFFSDVTERKRAEESLKQSNEELAQRTAELTENIEKLEIETAERMQAADALRLKEQLLLQQSRLAAMGEMIGNIAHQWRQPLNMLGLTIQQLKVSYRLGDFSEKLLDESIRDSMALIKHMSQTIDDFRNYFRPDKEKLDFNVRETIESTLSLLGASLKSKNIVIEVRAEGDPVIHGYHNEFAQVVLNILKNAVDVLSERGTTDPKIKITLGGTEGSCFVTVTDNAGGIPDGIMDRIFDPYFTTKGPQEGTGIGLYMSKTIIEKNMKGRLTVCNVAQGARFTIEV